MRQPLYRSLLLLLVFQLTFGTVCGLVPAQTTKTQTQDSKDEKNNGSATPPVASQGAGTTQLDSENQDSQENGITIGQPKQFDERTLTLMLQSLEDKLARTQFPDPNGLYNTVGRFGGATASTTSMALSVRGPSMPSITTTLGSGTKDGTSGSTTEEANQTSNETTNVGTTGTTSTSGSTTGDKFSNTSGNTSEASSSMQQQITRPGLAPPSAVAPGQTSMYSYQPQFGISSQDLLAEQTSLFYQIVNLRLLLDRSLTDRVNIEPKIIDGKPVTNTSSRDQVVLGFQVSIDAAHKDAVAEAEINITGTDIST